MLEAKVEIDLSGVEKKLSPANLDMGQKAMANQMLADMDDFVPYREGTLSQTATISTDGKELHWNTPYAKAQYNGGFTNHKGTVVEFKNYTTTFHPQAGPEWDKVAAGMFMEDWKKVYVEGAKLND